MRSATVSRGSPPTGITSSPARYSRLANSSARVGQGGRRDAEIKARLFPQSGQQIEQRLPQMCVIDEEQANGLSLNASAIRPGIVRHHEQALPLPRQRLEQRGLSDSGLSDTTRSPGADGTGRVRCPVR